MVELYVLFGVISSFLDGVKLHLPKRVAGLAILSDIITLARCVILQVKVV